MKKKFFLVLYRDDIPFSKYIEHGYLGATSLRLDIPSPIPTLPLGARPPVCLSPDQTKSATRKSGVFFACDLLEGSVGWRDLALQCG